MSAQNGLFRAARWLAHELGLATMRSAGKDVYIVIFARYIRLFAYGAVALVLAIYFQELGFSDEQIGLFMTLTLLGDVFISLLLTLVADSLGRRRTLLLGAIAMAVSGAVFATTSNYVALLMAAIIGVISPSGNEIGPFRAVEESTLAHLVSEAQRSDVYTWYVVLAVLGTSTGLAVGGVAVEQLQAKEGWTDLDAYRAIFWVYTGVGCVKAVMTLFLSRQCEHENWAKNQKSPAETEPLLNGNGSPENVESASQSPVPAKPTKRFWHSISTISKPSRSVLFKLCSLFFLDSLGSGMVPFSLINYYMERKFELPKDKLGGIMSATWFVSTIGTVFASSLAKRLGLIQAMVFTHLPSSVFLALLPVPSGLALTICLLVGRSVLNSMDQAPRSAFLSIVVLPEERTAVMGVVNILKTLAQSSGPSITGVLAGHGRFWVAFVVAGSLKAAYDLMLLAFFGGRVQIEKERAVEVDGRESPYTLPCQRTDSSMITGANRSTLRCAAMGILISSTVPCLITGNRRWRIPRFDPTKTILFLDAYDSFSNNIVALVEQNVDVEVIKIFIDDPLLTGVTASGDQAFTECLKGFDAVIAGPGPGWAKCDKDVGLMKELWEVQDEHLIPVLGICLGFQSLCLAFGAEIERLDDPKHGIISLVLHKGQSIFRDVEQLLATQYHSLQVKLGHPIQTNRAVRYPAQLWEPTETCPQLEPLAWDFHSERNGAVLMGVRHVQKPFWGVQFHPESICTNAEGKRVIQNWWEDAQAWKRKRMFGNVSKQSLLPNPQSLPKSFDDFRRELGFSNAKKNTTYSRAEFAAKLDSDTLAPEELASLVAHGDGQSLPDLPPSIVHCATTGSGRLTVADVCELLEIPRHEAIVLESGLQSNLVPMAVGTGRYSIIGVVIPGETLRLHYYAGSRRMQLRDGGDEVHTEWNVTDPWPYVREVMKSLQPSVPPRTSTWAPFWGGLMGYVSYEAGLEIIDIADHEEAHYPDICFAYITRSIVFDHHTKKVYVQSIRGQHDEPWVEETTERIYEAAGYKSLESTPGSTPLPKSDPFEQHGPMNLYIDSCKEVVVDGAEYCGKVSSCQSAIADGQSYELCLTTRNEIRAVKPRACEMWHSEDNEHSWNLYTRLAGQNPAPFGAYMRMHNVHILSSSPERYISWDRLQSAQCRPIKGTVQKKPGVTAESAHAILSSSKERAENLMIVDLTRHQLHGVYGSQNVRVSQLMEVEEYETLWQLVSVIDAVPSSIRKPMTPEEWEDPAEYASGVGTKDVPYLGFQAFVESLPPGSMTGAPKKRSCEILHKEEDGKRRGIYSGVLGYLDVGGGGDFSVVIRTAIKIDGPDSNKEDVWRIGAGGAVTSQSTPEGEYEEMLAKFQSTARAFQHQPQPERASKRKRFVELLANLRGREELSLDDAQMMLGAPERHSPLPSVATMMATEAPDPRSFQSWEDAFQYPIPVVRKLEQQLRSNADDNREKLRSLVGASYRNLLDTAETIIDMEVCMEQVEAKLSRVGQSYAERYTFASQLSILRNAPLVMTRLMKREGSYLLIAKVLVISRLLHKALSQAKNKPPIVDQLWERLLSIRRKLLRRIDKRLASTTGEIGTLVESMSAYALVTSSAPTDVLQHFHRVRLDKIVGELQQGGDELAKHGINALKLCIQTCLDTQTVFPRRLAEALAKLKTHALIQDPEVRALHELNLDVHDRWIGDEARNYTPWPRHDELQRPDAERLLHRWSKDAISAFLKGIKQALEHEVRLKEVASLRQDLIETWILSGSRMAGVKAANVLDDLRDVMNEKLESIVRLRTQGLQGVVSELTHRLNNLPASSDTSNLSLWSTTSRAADLSNGAQVFKTKILNTYQGRDQYVIAVTSAFDKWMDSVLEVKSIVKSMKEARWDDTFADDDGDESDDDFADSKQMLLSADDPKLLEDVTQEALSDALQSLGTEFAKIVETSTADEMNRSVQKSAFILRAAREVGDRIPRLRLQDKFTPLVSPFTADILQPLHVVVATSIVEPTMTAFQKTLAASTKAKSSSHILWEGNPALPSHPSPSTFRFLKELNTNMASLGSDLWAPGCVSVLKGQVSDAVRRVLGEHVETFKALPEDTSKPVEDSNVEEGGEVKQVDSAETSTTQELRDHKYKQLLFDALYIQRVIANRDEKNDALMDSLRKTEIVELDDAAMNRMRKSAADYAKKTYLLFALLA
ncbi:para-aminobenzoate synthase [Cucurbitaria berberidis CBS 394.84]|uniref:aminodeoxychorismate synthase n=1 Tax=Cucurbitaria berberidis CBS 394.84 TaxID=1168544 RepID=A0A9P4GFZ3_9PLEO|nr:para-aminobenzoate synthase [Cucurbitaria berberidis CBS 394.84]KAF1844739.1 para-aminobenzoate synthase [Cucurbitaria berberidis CBS 394.84]